MSASPGLFLIGLAFLGTGCLRFAWNRELRHEPIQPADIARLENGRTELAECLAGFGAPLWVWEHVEEGRATIVLAYGWFRERDRGLRVSVPVYRALSASFDYDRTERGMRGLVLFFDEDCRLSAWRQGSLRDLTRELRRPPAWIEPAERDERPEEDA